MLDVGQPALPVPIATELAVIVHQLIAAGFPVESDVAGLAVVAQGLFEIGRHRGR